MSQSLGNLVVTLEANMVRFNQNMEEAARRTEQGANRMQAGLSAAKAAVAALAGAATVGVLDNLVKGAIDAADSLRDMSQKTGIAVETLNGLGFAAGQAGGSLESMVGAAGKLNKSIADAAGGGKDTGAAFKALGIDVNDASGKLKTADVVMAEIADRFKDWSDGPEKTAIAVALFSKAGADMIPVLNDGGGAMRDNIEYAKKYSGMTTELSNMSDEFNDTMGKLNLQQKSFGNVLAEAVLPAVNAVASEILGATEESNKFSLAAEVIRTVLETFLVVGAEVAHIFHMVGDEIGGTAAQLVALSKLDFEEFKGIGAAMERDQAQALVDHEAFIKKILDRTPRVAVDGTPVVKDKPAAPRLPGTPDKKKKEGKSEEEKALEEGAKLVAKLKEQADAYGLTGAALLEYQLASKGYSAQQKEQALAHQVNIDGMKAEDAAAKASSEQLKKFVADELQAQKKNAADVEQIRASLMTNAQAEDEYHAATLAQLQLFHDTKLENVMLANSLMEAETARHEQAKMDVRAQTDQMMLSSYAGAAGQLYALMQQAGMEQTAIGKAAFLATKALAVAQIIVSTNVAAAAALAPPPLGLGPIAGMGLAGTIKALGYASAGMTAGLAIAQASARDGYDIPDGVNPVTQLHEQEMVLPKAQANVIRDMAAGGGGAGQNVTYAPVIQIDSRTDQAQVRQLVARAVQDGNADLVERLQRAGRI